MDCHKNLLENDGDDGVANVMLWPHFFWGGVSPFSENGWEGNIWSGLVSGGTYFQLAIALAPLDVVGKCHADPAGPFHAFL